MKRVNEKEDGGAPSVAVGGAAAFTGSALLPNPMLRTMTAPPNDNPVATSRLTTQPGVLRFVGAGGGGGAWTAACWAAGCATTGCTAGTAGCSAGSDGDETINGAATANSGSVSVS